MEISKTSVDVVHDFSVVPEEVLGDFLFKESSVLELELGPSDKMFNCSASIFATGEEMRDLFDELDGSEGTRDVTENAANFEVTNSVLDVVVDGSGIAPASLEISFDVVMSDG